jgi:hypothetical protein
MRLDEHLAGLKDRLGGAELGSTLPAGTIGSHNGLRPVKTSPGFRGFKKGSAAHYDASYSKQEWSRRRLQWVLPSSSGRCSCPSCRSWKKDPHHRRRCGCRCHKQRDPRSGQGDRHNRTLFLRYYYSIRSFQPHPSSDHHPPDHQQQAPPPFRDRQYQGTCYDGTSLVVPSFFTLTETDNFPGAATVSSSSNLYEYPPMASSSIVHQPGISSCSSLYCTGAQRRVRANLNKTREYACFFLILSMNVMLSMHYFFRIKKEDKHSRFPLGKEDEIDRSG